MLIDNAHYEARRTLYWDTSLSTGDAQMLQKLRLTPESVHMLVALDDVDLHQHSFMRHVLFRMPSALSRRRARSRTGCSCHATYMLANGSTTKNTESVRLRMAPT